MSSTDFDQVSRESPFPLTLWSADFGFTYLPQAIKQWQADYGLDLDPELQRARVWTQEQKEAFIIYSIQQGPSGRDIYFASQGWNSSKIDKLYTYIVDGKQRLTTVLDFMEDRLPVRGKLYSEWSGTLRLHLVRFRFHVADITPAAAIDWYLALNTAGTPHTAEEIASVKKLRERLAP